MSILSYILVSPTLVSIHENLLFPIAYYPKNWISVLSQADSTVPVSRPSSCL